MAKKTSTPDSTAPLTVEVSPEELQALLAARSASTAPKVAEPTVGTSQLADALIQAINAAKPPEKKNAFNRKAQTAWTPKDGAKKLKLKRKMYHHGLLLDEDILSNDEIDRLNKIRPGLYCDGIVTVYRRKDRGIDINYSVKTAAQRLRLVNQFGIRNLAELCDHFIMEAAQPKRPDAESDLD